MTRGPDRPRSAVPGAEADEPPSTQAQAAAPRGPGSLLGCVAQAGTPKPREARQPRRLERHRKFPGRGLGPTSGRGCGGRWGFVGGPAGLAAAGPCAGRWPSSRRWTPGEWRASGRRRGPARACRTPGLRTPASRRCHGRRRDCSAACGPQPRALGSVMGAGARGRALGSRPSVRGRPPRRGASRLSAVSQFPSPRPWAVAWGPRGGDRCGLPRSFALSPPPSLEPEGALPLHDAGKAAWASILCGRGPSPHLPRWAQGRQDNARSRIASHPRA